MALGAWRLSLSLMGLRFSHIGAPDGGGGEAAERHPWEQRGGLRGLEGSGPRDRARPPAAALAARLWQTHIQTSGPLKRQVSGRKDPRRSFV